MINYLKSMTTDPETLRQLQEAADLFAEAEILARSDATPEMALAEIAMSGRQLIFVLPLLILLLTVFARYNKKRRAEARPAPQTFQPPEGDFSYKDYLESRGVIAPSENKEAKQEVYEKTSKTELIVIAAAVLVYIIIALVMPSLAGSVPTV
jgi:hypothetical protein